MCFGWLILGSSAMVLLKNCALLLLWISRQPWRQTDFWKRSWLWYFSLCRPPSWCSVDHPSVSRQSRCVSLVSHSLQSTIKKAQNMLPMHINNHHPIRRHINSSLAFETILADTVAESYWLFAILQRKLIALAPGSGTWTGSGLIVGSNLRHWH